MDASSVSGSLAVAVDDRDFDDALAEFDRDRPADGATESLPLVLRQAGLMPADVAEECVQGTLAALRSAHERRWSHGRLALDAYLLDEQGDIRLSGIGGVQREAYLRVNEAEVRDVVAFDREERSDRRWNDAFLTGAAEDFRCLGPQILAPLLQAIDGPCPLWAERLVRSLDGLDGTIASLDDVDHAWKAIDACFRTGETSGVPAPSSRAEANGSERNEATAPIPDTPAPAPVEALPASPATHVAGASRVVLFWVCVVGGFAAMAGTLATVIVGR